MNKAQITLWTNQALPSTGTVTSAPIPIGNYLGYAVQIIYGSGATGTFTLQGSCDAGVVLQNGTVANVSNWSTITTTAISGSAGNVLYNEPNTYYYWFQISYTATSGTGTANASAVIKG